MNRATQAFTDGREKIVWWVMNKEIQNKLRESAMKFKWVDTNAPSLTDKGNESNSDKKSHQGMFPILWAFSKTEIPKL